MDRVKIGVYVILHNWKGPWKIWEGDRFVCAQCNHQIITDFGDPIDNFAYNKEFRQALEYAGNHPHYFFYNLGDHMAMLRDLLAKLQTRRPCKLTDASGNVIIPYKGKPDNQGRKGAE